MKTLRGIAWNHTRGFVSVVATAQRFEELHPEIRIQWEKRSLQAFADESLADLAERFDLIVMDHPHTALAAAESLLLPYDDWLSAAFLNQQAANSVGASHPSYRFNDRQWTLATDAAAPIATWRPDLIERYELALPQTWDDLVALARAGHVTVSAFPVDILMHSYMFSEALGGKPFENGQLAIEEALAEGLELLRVLVSLCDATCLERNPIRTAEWMSSVDDDPRAAYCPFAYGYSNYSRPGYARHPLKAGGLVRMGQVRLRSTLGGAGLAVSAKTKHPRACMDYAAFSASLEVQKGIYFTSGGQPGNRIVWTDMEVNEASMNFFQDTLETLDEALVRPQFPDYMAFQDAGTPIAHACVTGQSTPVATARELNRLYRACFTRNG